MRQLLFGLAALSFLAGSFPAGVAVAAQPLSDSQMDGITAGATASPLVLPSSLTEASAPAVTGAVTTTGGMTASACPGCTGGQVFTVSPTQQLLPALIQFLINVGFPQQ